MWEVVKEAYLVRFFDSKLKLPHPKSTTFGFSVNELKNSLTAVTYGFTVFAVCDPEPEKYFVLWSVVQPHFSVP